MTKPSDLFNRSGAGAPLGQPKPANIVNLTPTEDGAKQADKADAKAKGGKPKQSGGTHPNIGSGGGAGKAATGVRPKV